MQNQNPIKSSVIDDSLVFKFILVGDTGVGKSSILLKYCEDRFVPEHNVTVGVDFRSKTVQLDPTSKVKIQIWDTAGQETFGTIVRSFYRDAAGILLVYDVKNLDTFKNLETWLQEVRTHCEYDPIYVLIGNQCDNGERQVSQEEARRFMEECSIDLFFETSAYNGQNIDKAFIEAVKLVYLHYMQEKAEQNIPTRSMQSKGSKLSQLSNPTIVRKKGGCC